MPLYFAYGSNMDAAAMARRCPSSKAIGGARLMRHRFVITTDGYASVIRNPRATVHGLLWDLALADIPALDRYESVGTGLYTKAFVPVVAGQGARKALVYFGTGSDPGQPRPGYMESVIKAARAVPLPDAYLRELMQWLPNGGGMAMADAPPRPRVTPRAAAPSSSVIPRTRVPKT